MALTLPLDAGLGGRRHQMQYAMRYSTVTE
jgi:hypothetical protein